MATLSFPTLPEGFTDIPLSRSIRKLFKIDGALAADDSVIEAATTLRYYAAAPDYGWRSKVLSVEITGSFTYSSLATVDGTMTGITIRLDGTELLTLTDLSVDAATAWVSMTGSSTPLAVVLSGDDTITGTAGFDSLSGHAGNDVIDALDGGSSLSGGGGNDRLIGGAGYDYIRGGAGRDRITGGDDTDSLEGGAGRDVIRGQGGRDNIRGDTGSDLLIGGRGADTINGGLGDDVLSGGAGNDRLFGDKGDDSLSGGLGEDHFIFSRFGVGTRSGNDIITDFEAGDVIGLGRIENEADVIVTQVGDDVAITHADPEVDNQIMVLGATAAEVEAAIATTSLIYY